MDNLSFIVSEAIRLKLSRWQGRAPSEARRKNLSCFFLASGVPGRQLPQSNVCPNVFSLYVFSDHPSQIQSYMNTTHVWSPVKLGQQYGFQMYMNNIHMGTSHAQIPAMYLYQLHMVTPHKWIPAVYIGTNNNWSGVHLDPIRVYCK